MIDPEPIEIDVSEPFEAIPEGLIVGIINGVGGSVLVAMIAAWIWWLVRHG